ncbi:unnamed protein product, partial [Heterotrigona itama]
IAGTSLERVINDAYNDRRILGLKGFSLHCTINPTNGLRFTET